MSRFGNESQTLFTPEILPAFCLPCQTSIVQHLQRLFATIMKNVPKVSVELQNIASNEEEQALSQTANTSVT